MEGENGIPIKLMNAHANESPRLCSSDVRRGERRNERGFLILRQ
jgi:hypothetical protein